MKELKTFEERKELINTIINYIADDCNTTYVENKILISLWELADILEIHLF